MRPFWAKIGDAEFFNSIDPMNFFNSSVGFSCGSILREKFTAFVLQRAFGCHSRVYYLFDSITLQRRLFSVLFS